MKDDDGNDTFRPSEEAAITINHVTITTYTAEVDNDLDTVADTNSICKPAPAERWQNCQTLRGRVVYYAIFKGFPLGGSCHQR